MGSKNKAPKASCTVTWKPLGRCESGVIAALSLLQGGLLGWAAVVLPWTLNTPFAALAGAAALGHGTCAVLCLINIVSMGQAGAASDSTDASEIPRESNATRWPRRAATAWRISALLSLGLLLFCCWMVLTASSYLVGLYGHLGEGFAAVLLAILGQVVLLTLPMASWALVRTRGLAPSLRGGVKGLFALGLVFGLGGASAWSKGSPGQLRQSLSPPQLETLASAHAAYGVGHPVPLSASGPVECAQSPAQVASLVLSYRRSAASNTTSRCIQGPDREQLVKQAVEVIKKSKARGYLKLDLVTATDPAEGVSTVLEALAFRPGLDGACAGQRCLMPWQLLSRGEYLRHRPLDFLRDLRFGVSFKRLRRLLKAEDTDEPLLRIRTQSVVISGAGEITTLRRMRATGPLLTNNNLKAASLAAEHQILEAQDDKGKFRYTLNPFTGKASSRNFNLPRQAGTTLVLCEMGTSDNVAQVQAVQDAVTGATAKEGQAVALAIERALTLLVKHERTTEDGTLGALSKSKRPSIVRLGPSALTLAALATCRERVGPKFDGAIARLTRFVLRMQRESGGFYPGYRMRKTKGRSVGVIDGGEPLYVSGQAILALVTLENWAKRAKAGEAGASIEGLPDRQRLSAAVDRGMHHVAHSHWNHPLRDFFFVEENWHCLAARAALRVHENADYEKFCFDYMRFKSRLILEEDSDVDPEFVGGFGFGNVIPPHNTGAAGFAEALAATIAVKQARGLDATSDVTLLKKVMEFLLRQQWMPRNAFAIKPTALGAWSEHTHSPVVRIDFVQHAWAGLGHGAEVIGLGARVPNGS